MPKKNKNEDVDVVIRPITRSGGLDNIHIALIALVIILIALLFVISGSSKIMIVNSTNTTTTIYTGILASNYTCTNGKCSQPMHSISQVRNYTEQVLASYSYVNGSISLISYFSDIANATYSYVPKDGRWYVTVPEINPSTGTKFDYSLVIHDSNLSIDYASVETVKPSQVVRNKVVAQGVISVNNKLTCSIQNPVQISWFMDPYAPGAVSSLNNVTALENKFGGSVNLTIKILFRGSTAQIANQSGSLFNAQELGKYILCASEQSNFARFRLNLESAYGGSYLSQPILQSISNSSRLNITQLNSCISNSTPLLNRQSLLAQYYNITTTPVAVVNCKYLALPQTAIQAVCYNNSSTCDTKVG